jgi:hypothetical protein
MPGSAPARVVTAGSVLTPPGVIYRHPWRKVVRVEEPAWWDLLGTRRDWYLTGECGHMVVRRAAAAPARVRCEACDMQVVGTSS